MGNARARPGESFRQAAPRWLTRRIAIVAHYQHSRSMAVTAKAFGISRQRVHQIIAYVGRAA